MSIIIFASWTKKDTVLPQFIYDEWQLIYCLIKLPGVNSSDHNIITLGSFFNLLFFDYYCDNNHDKHETGNLEFGDMDSSSLL